MPQSQVTSMTKISKEQIPSIEFNGDMISYTKNQTSRDEKQVQSILMKRSNQNNTLLSNAKGKSKIGDSSQARYKNSKANQDLASTELRPKDSE